MRKTTNSAGLTGAMPITQISLPLSISSAVIVDASQRTKKACSGLAPGKAPTFHSFRRKSSTVRRTALHSVGPFSSKTTHWVPTSIDLSRYAKYLRMLTYFHSGSSEMVRAPHTKRPRPVKKRRQFTPRTLSWSDADLSSSVSTSSADRTTSLAGALDTPRSLSVRAKTPATYEAGGTLSRRPSIGCDTVSHG